MWLERASSPRDVEVIISVDGDYQVGIDAALTAQSSVALADAIKVVRNDGERTCVAGWNAGAAQATGDVLIAVADDFNPPDNWDRLLRECSLGDWWLHDRVVAVADGYNTDIFTLGIVTRRRYERFGYLFYPGYQSLFSDTELTAVAHLEKVIIDARHLLFEHMHPDCQKRARDEVDLHHASTQRWKHGETLFNFRRDTGFPIDAGPVAESLSDSYEHLCFALYVQAIRDDFCLPDVLKRIADEVQVVLGPEVVSRLTSPGGTPFGSLLKVYIAAPDEYWGGKLQSDDDKIELVRAIEEFRRSHPGVPVELLTQPVAPHRHPGFNRIQVETEVRNAAIDCIRADGYKHILVADGDELWLPGLMARLVDYVRERRPASVFTGMVPTIGLPGYPIDGATDKATIYIGPGAWFVDCRGVSGHRHELPSNDIIHFTATRRTLDEIISKSRESGHADDPSYAFEEWIEKVLPNVRPGFVHRWSPTNVGLHMFRPYQVWPRCRAWTLAEWTTLPEAVKLYLAAP